MIKGRNRIDEVDEENGEENDEDEGKYLALYPSVSLLLISLIFYPHLIQTVNLPHMQDPCIRIGLVCDFIKPIYDVLFPYLFVGDT